MLVRLFSSDHCWRSLKIICFLGKTMLHYIFLGDS